MNHKSDNRSDTKTLRPSPWMTALLILQSLTLVIVLSASGVMTPAAAPAAVQGHDRQILPNAADQRQEQIVLLRQVVAELGKVNANLEKLGKGDQPATQR